MISLVFVTCLVGSPIDCLKRDLPIYEEVSHLACLMGAQAELARWRESHPGHRIVQWRCERVKLAQVDK